MAVKQRKTKNGSWYIDFQINGKRIRQVIKEARTRRQAEQAERVLRDEIFENRYGIGGQKLFEKFVEESYKPYAKENNRGFSVEESVLKVLIEKFGKKKLCEITTEDVENFKSHRASAFTRFGTVRSKSTVNRDIAVLSAVFSLAQRYSEIKEHPIKGKVKFYSNLNSRTRTLSDEEELALFDLIKDDVKFSNQIEILLYTGMRRGEFFSLEWRDIDLVKGFICLRGDITKSGKSRIIPMLSNVQNIFESIKNETENIKPDKLVFDARFTQKHSFTIKFRQFANKLGLTDLNVHSLRHTFSTRANKYNVDAFAQKALLGHSKLTMTDRYTHVSLETLKDSLTGFEQNIRRANVTIEETENNKTDKPLNLLEFKKNS